MKKMIIRILLPVMLMSLWGCAPAPAESQPPETSAESPAAETTAAIEAEAAVSPAEEERPLFLKVSAITFSLVGESEDIYLGFVPREQITWESDDPAVVSVENGVLTANGVGTTTVRAIYNDRQIQVTAGCLARTQEELEGLGFQVLTQPKRLIPEVDLETPCTYFDKDALVGDSISYMLLQSESKGNYLGELLFMARGGTSLNSFVFHTKNIHYQGINTNLEDAIAKSQVERAYFLIGSSDIASEPQREAFFQNWDVLLERIREKSPDVDIVMISNIPRYANEQEAKGSYFLEYNALIAEYNEKLRQYAADNDCKYLDIYYYIQDHCGRTPQAYNLDGFHLNDEGYQVWMKIMRYYAQYELEGGTLS